MADGIVYIKWYFNDWLGSGTRAEMTPLDRAIFKDLLDHQAASGSLPDDESALTRMAMCAPGELTRFMTRWGDILFPKGDDGRRRNPKQDEVRKAIVDELQKKSAGGRKSAERRSKGGGNILGNILGKTLTNNRTSGFDFDSVFSDWWDCYPHKVGKKAARKAFERALADAEPDVLMAGLRRYVATKPPDRNWCNPATWLNQGRWEDKPSPDDLPVEVAAREATDRAAARQDAERAEADRRREQAEADRTALRHIEQTAPERFASAVDAAIEKHPTAAKRLRSNPHGAASWALVWQELR